MGIGLSGVEGFINTEYSKVEVMGRGFLSYCFSRVYRVFSGFYLVCSDREGEVLLTGTRFGEGDIGGLF